MSEFIVSARKYRPATFASVVVISDRREAIRYAILTAKPRDLILLAGKGHEEYEIDREGKHPFCEKEIAKAAALRYQHMTPREQQREEMDE